jgi:hypothetical protein
MAIIPALGKQRQEDREFKARLSYITRPISKKYIYIWLILGNQTT